MTHVINVGVDDGVNDQHVAAITCCKEKDEHCETCYTNEIVYIISNISNNF